MSNDGANLLIHLDSISAIGEEYNLGRLDDYVYTPTEQIAEFLLSAGASEEEIERANPELWFSPEEGLSLMQSYIDVITQYHTLSDTTKSMVVPELKEFCAILEVLYTENNQWHLEYDL